MNYVIESANYCMTSARSLLQSNRCGGRKILEHGLRGEVVDDVSDTCPARFRELRDEQAVALSRAVVHHEDLYVHVWSPLPTVRRGRMADACPRHIVAAA
ncbi:hypothetical protein [Burkholderia ubonensis]|uniref:hypothetical protein n=1 Tax=Burkholderia ubonensis TaxID=101571 RepID=UPI0015A6BD22|nr:hypothetical protein [Burkholderia ubonensis]